MTAEISVQQLAARLQENEAFILLDVRELWELERAKITDARLQVLPLSRLQAEGLAGLPEAARQPDAEIFVLCHHGLRSAQVTDWLAAQGWKRAFSVAGGLEAYAAQIDASVGRY